jgi:hypothetical protein
MTFVDPRELRQRKVAALREQLALTTDDHERARIETELRELTRFRWKRPLWPGGPHGDS